MLLGLNDTVTWHLTFFHVLERPHWKATEYQVMFPFQYEHLMSFDLPEKKVSCGPDCSSELLSIYECVALTEINVNFLISLVWTSGLEGIKIHHHVWLQTDTSKCFGKWKKEILIDVRQTEKKKNNLLFEKNVYEIKCCKPMHFVVQYFKRALICVHLVLII